MKLSELKEVLAEIKQVIPIDNQHDESAACIVNSTVFGLKGTYTIVIKNEIVNDETFAKLTAIADKHGLSIRTIKDYLVFYRY